MICPSGQIKLDQAPDVSDFLKSSLYAKPPAVKSMTRGSGTDTNVLSNSGHDS